VSIVAITSGTRNVERRMRRRRAAKLTLLIAFAFVWIPVAIVMVIAGMPDRRA
jgi:hypothetical protein